MSIAFRTLFVRSLGSFCVGNMVKHFATCFYCDFDGVIRFTIVSTYFWKWSYAKVNDTTRTPNKIDFPYIPLSCTKWTQGPHKKRHKCDTHCLCLCLNLRGNLSTPCVSDHFRSLYSPWARGRFLRGGGHFCWQRLPMIFRSNIPWILRKIGGALFWASFLASIAF